MKKKDSRLDDYVVTAAPDYMMMKNLVLKCKGNKPNFDFAKQIGTSPSTLSRIINGKHIRPIPDYLLLAIFDERDPECRVSLEELMLANGKTKVDFNQKKSLQFEVKRQEEVEAICRILVERLFQKNHTIRQMTLQELEISNELNLVPEFEWVVEIDGIRNAYIFDLYEKGLEKSEINSLSKTWLKRQSTPFLFDFLSNTKIQINIVFTNLNLYWQIKEMLSSYETNNKFCLMHVDLDKKEVSSYPLFMKGEKEESR